MPPGFRDVARRAGTVLKTHRGFDAGTAELGRLLARRLQAPLFVGRWSRLLVELNRSLHHPQLWSEFTRDLPRNRKEAILRTSYHPYRTAVTAAIEELLLSRRPVLHVSLHSFAPSLHGIRRRADLGLLYDPARWREKAFCGQWRERLHGYFPRLVIRRNYPYRGVADGLTTHLRRRFPARDYLGIELEINQMFPLARPADWRRLRSTIATTLEEVLQGVSW